MLAVKEQEFMSRNVNPFFALRTSELLLAMAEQELLSIIKLQPCTCVVQHTLHRILAQ